MHRAVHNVAGDIEGLRFNRAVAQIYELTNALAKFTQTTQAVPDSDRIGALGDGVERLIQLIAPMMPTWPKPAGRRLASPAWSPMRLARSRSISAGRRQRGHAHPDQRQAPRRNYRRQGTPAAEVEQLVLSLEDIVRILDGKAPKKIVIVPDRIVNVVV